MSSAYVLKNRVLASRFELEISKEAFERLRDAQELFSVVFHVEESLDILMENFFALESGAQSAVIRDMIQRNHSYAHFSSMRSDLTRHTINLLATFTAYISTLKRTKIPTGEIQNAADLVLSVFRDNENCRLLEVVRDISQHRDLPVSGLTLGASWKGADGGKWNPREAEAHRSHYTVDFYLNANKIRDDRKSKVDPKTLASLEKISLPMLIRRSIEAVGLAHLEFRKAISPRLALCQQETRSAIELYQSHTENKPSNLYAVAKDGSQPDVLIIDDHFAYVSGLQEKNSSYINLSKRVATSHADD